MDSSKPNFKDMYLYANEALIRCDIERFPFSITSILKDYFGITCCSYENALTKHNVNPMNLGSDSALLTINNGKVILFYNQENSRGRIRFSLAHELAHLISNHELNCKITEKYHTQEIEANFFAAQFLMPKQILCQFIKRGLEINIDFLTKTFEVSNDAAVKRLEFLRRTSNMNITRDDESYDDIIVIKFSKFTNEVIAKIPHDYYFDDDLVLEKERDLWR